MTIDDKLNRMEALRKGTSPDERNAAQHARGKLTARERIELLLDPGTFHEIGGFITHRATDFGMSEQKEFSDAVVTGSGEIDGRPVFVFSQDFTFIGGTISDVVGQKVGQVMDRALER